MSLKTICALPFGHLFLSEEGKSYPCCYALETGAVNLTEEGNAIEVRAASDTEAAWNSPTQRRIRRQMLAGERPTACERCFTLEDHGLQSLRQVSNLRFEGELAAAKEKTAGDGTQPLEFFSLDLRLGNFCNLRCQMCSPVSSRKMIEDFRELYPEGAAGMEHLAGINWQSSERLREEILRHASSLREAHFAGGEPFLIPEVEAYVRALSLTPYAKNVRLSFNTNATVLPERLLGLFSHFEGVRLIISLDGIGAVNDYIRFPSKFERVAANISELHQRREEWNLTFVCFNVTVQAHNLLQMPQLIRHLTHDYPGFLPFPVLSPLRVPDCLSAQVLPPVAKAQARNSLLNLIQEEWPFWLEIEGRDPNPGAAERFKGHVLGLLEFMDSEDRRDLLPELKRFSKVLERTRGPAPKIPGF